MATRTAPALTGNPSYETLTVQFVDATGDNTSMTFRIDPARVDNASAEAFLAELQLVTQASIYQAVISQQWRGVEGVDNADVGARNSVFDGINMLFRQPDFTSQTIRVPAPVSGTILPNTDDPVASALDPLADDFVTVSLPAGMVWESAAYTERSESNKRRKVASS